MIRSVRRRVGSEIGVATFPPKITATMFTIREAAIICSSLYYNAKRLRQVDQPIDPQTGAPLDYLALDDVEDEIEALITRLRPFLRPATTDSGPSLRKEAIVDPSSSGASPGKVETFISVRGNYQIELPWGMFKIDEEGDGDLSLVDAGMPSDELFRSKIDLEIIWGSAGRFDETFNAKIKLCKALNIELTPGSRDSTSGWFTLKEETIFPAVGYGKMEYGVRVGSLCARIWDKHVLLFTARVALDEPRFREMVAASAFAWRGIKANKSTSTSVWGQLFKRS